MKIDRETSFARISICFRDRLIEDDAVQPH